MNILTATREAALTVPIQAVVRRAIGEDAVEVRALDGVDLEVAAKTGR